jgi:hypothetical protein
MQPWLTDEEIADLCAGLKQPAAQIRFIRQLGLAVRIKPNGRPLVMRADFEALKTPAANKLTPQRGPNRTALVAHFEKAA